MEVLTRQPTQVRPEAAPWRSSMPLVGILLAGAALRLVLWLYWADLPVRIVDAQDYNGLAVRLVETGKYISRSGQPISLRPPLYPAFLAAIYQVFGLENHAAVRAIQGLLGLVTTLVVFRLGSELYSRRVGLWSAAAVCFYPSLVGFQYLLLSETLFTLLVCSAVLSLVIGYRRTHLGWLALSGVLLGLGALTRSILWPITLLLALYIGITWPQKLGRRVQAAAVVLGLFVLVIGPWSYRNTRLHRTLTLVDVMGGRNAMMGNYEYTPMERSWATIAIAKGDKAWHEVLFRRHPELRGKNLTQGQLDKAAKQYAKEFILAHPWLTMQRDLVKFFNYWQLERTLVAGAVDGIFGPMPRWLIAVAALVIWAGYAAAMFAGIFGVLLVRPADWRLHALMVGMISIPCLLHTLVFAHSRYHLPFIPLLLVYAVAAILNWRPLWQQRGRMLFKVGIVMCAILVAGWIREIVLVDFTRLN